jgi:hypothetical protein
MVLHAVAIRTAHLRQGDGSAELA